MGEAGGTKRVWRPADINLDWFGGAMQAVWIIACSNDWPVLLWQAMDATGQTTGPAQNNSLAVGLLFLLVSMLAGIVIMNSAVGVYMAAYTQLLQRTTRAPRILPRPTRPALPIIYHPSIDGSPGGLRQRVQRIIDGRTFDAAINAAVMLSLLALALQASLCSLRQPSIPRPSRAARICDMAQNGFRLRSTDCRTGRVPTAEH